MKKNSNGTAPDETFSLISNQKLLALYAAMVECRKKAASAKAQMPGRSGRAAASLDSIVGCEAAFVGAAIDLGSGDAIAAKLLAESVLRAVNRSVFIAAELGLNNPGASAIHGNLNVSIVFSNRKEAEQISWRKMLERTIRKSRAVLFVCLTDGQESLLAGTTAQISMHKRRYALPTITVDGCDVVAVYRVVSEAITHARKGNGATWIECVIEPSRDPIEYMAQYLRRKGLLDESPASRVGA